MIVERAYAKINLTLDVLGKREDGYHEVDMVMQTVDLSDLVWIEERDSEAIEIESNSTQLPIDARNLAFAAAQRFREYTGIRRGLHIRIDKNIPIAAGMGGGSADTAAVLRALNRLWDCQLSQATLAELGASIGSDVPFCVYGGCAVARGRGEQIELGPPPAKLWAVVVRPNCHVSTGDVYGNLEPVDYAQEPNSPNMIAALQAGDIEGIHKAISNSLTNTTLRLYPEVAQMRDRVAHTLRTEVYMSGSGPTLFSLVPSLTSAQRVYNALRGFAREVHLCRFV